MTIRRHALDLALAVAALTLTLGGVAGLIRPTPATPRADIWFHGQPAVSAPAVAPAPAVQ